MVTWLVLRHRDSRAHIWRKHTAPDETAVRAACGIIDSTEAGPLAVDESAPRCRWCVREMDPEYVEARHERRKRAKVSSYSPVGSRAYHVRAKRSPG